MRHFALRNGRTIPAIGLGTWRAGQGEAAQSVFEALKSGYRHIDGAHVYQNETEIGGVYQDVFGEGKRGLKLRREEVFITSKLWNTSHHPSKVAKACEKTLKNLGLDYLDLYLMHWPLAFKEGGARNASGAVEQDPGITLGDTWEAMRQLVKAGKVKAIGVSNFTLKHLSSLPGWQPQAGQGEGADQGGLPAVLQVEMHPLWPQNELLSECRRRGIHVTAYSPLGSTPHQSRPGESVLSHPTITRIAKELNKEPAQVALAWGLQRGTSVIPKSAHPPRIRSNLQSDLDLSPEHFEEISQIETRKRFVQPLEFFGIDVFEDGPSKL